MEARHGGLDMLGYESSFPCIIESFPSLLSQLTEDHFKILAEFLKSLGVPQPSIGIILLLFPPVIFYDMEKEMKPRIHALGEVLGAHNLHYCLFTGVVFRFLTDTHTTH